MTSKNATTLDKDEKVKFAKRIISQMKTGDGKMANRAAGHNDVGSLIKGQFDPTMRTLTDNNTFANAKGEESERSRRQFNRGIK